MSVQVFPFNTSVDNFKSTCREIAQDVNQGDSAELKNKIEKITNQFINSFDDANKESYIHSEVVNLISTLNSSPKSSVKKYAKQLNAVVAKLTHPNAQNVPSKSVGRDKELEGDGISPNLLKKCKNLPFKDVVETGRQFALIDKNFSEDVGKLERYDENTQDATQRPEAKLFAYLSKNTDNTCKFRNLMGGYIGHTEPEIARNLQAACWNFALAGCCGTEGPNQVDAFIIPQKFYVLFSPLLLDEKLNEFYGPPIRCFEDLIRTDLIRNQLTDINKEDYQKFLPYKNQIEGIWKELSAHNCDNENTGKEVMSLYLTICGMEVASEEDRHNSPYSIALVTDNREEIGWCHWGIEVSTNRGTHTFETFPFASIAHTSDSFASIYRKNNNFVISVPIKSLPDRQLQLIKEIINLGSVK